MAKRIFTSAGLTFTATAAGSVATTSGYMALKAGAVTQLVDVLEILVSGKNSASVVGGFRLQARIDVGDDAYRACGSAF